MLFCYRVQIWDTIGNRQFGSIREENIYGLADLYRIMRKRTRFQLYVSLIS